MRAVAADDLVLDLRSTGYAAMWAPTGAAIKRTTTVRVLHERLIDGVARRSVVSHFNKATKGRIVRDLATAGAEPHTPDRSPWRCETSNTASNKNRPAAAQPGSTSS